MSVKIDTNDLIAKMLIQELYTYPKEDEEVFTTNYYDSEIVKFMEANPLKSSSVDPKLLAVVPQDVYHPEIKIAIDFTHQFVQTTEEIQGKRPVDAKVFEILGFKIIAFAKRYFDYVMSVGGNTKFISDITRDYDMAEQNEESMNLLINRIINYFLTRVSVSRSRKQIGNASLTFKDVKNPVRNGRGNYRIFFDSTFRIFNQLLAPMLPITIWGRGRLYKNWYFPIFDGYIVSTSPTDSNGFVEYQIVCKDALELARISVEMINPAIIQYAENKKVDAINLLRKPFYGHDHFEIVRKMIRGGKLIYDPVTKATQIQDKHNVDIIRQPTITEPPGIPKKHDPEHAPADLDGLPLTALGNFEDVSEDPGKLFFALANIGVYKEKFTDKYRLDYVSHTDARRRKFIAWGDKLTPYRIWTLQSPNIFTSTFATRLDVLTEVAELVYYDFYIDGCGNFHYHPMRLTNEFLMSNAVIYDTSAPGNKKYLKRTFKHAQVICPEETFSVSTALNIEELVTFLRVTGQEETIKAPGELTDLYGSAIDKSMIARYGYRRKELNNTLFNVNQHISNKITFLDVAAMVMMQFANAELYTRQQTIAFRPELDIASPVIFSEDNNVFYINSIEHNFVVGADATTNINCSFGRRDMELAPDLSSVLLATETAYNLKSPLNTDVFWSKIKIANWQNYLDSSDETLSELELMESVRELNEAIAAIPDESSA